MGDRSVPGLEPGELAGSKIPAYAVPDAGNYPIDPILPNLVLVNTDSAAHVVTLRPRFSGQVAGHPTQAPVPVSIASLTAYPVPTATFGAFSDASGNGLLFAYYSDNALPRGAPGGGGQQLAASVFESPHAVLYTPASTGNLMLGLAAQITPKATGRLEFLVTVGLYVYETDVLGVLVMYGTGTPPIQGAALTGTEVGNAAVNAGGDASLPAGTLDIPLTVVADIQLATGTKYWFDVAIAWGSTHDSVSMAAWSLKEIP